ncbi:MAG: phenylalanine--tRNA ligase subunit beta [Deltaproteobacteria bacterium]|nr:phenylalanine--tRNA ligase subunit beta [Deltaproteobacteria bacterium]
MFISRNWLMDFVDLAELSMADFSDVITTKVAEVDSVFTLGEPLQDAIICKIVSLLPHPHNPKLNLAKISLGEKTCEVVCGAPNCVAGLITAYLPPRARCCDSANQRELKTVEARDIAGIQSSGFLASEAELGLTTDHAGIIELDSSCAKFAGKSLASVLDGPDVVLEIDNKSLTHRPDLWGQFGFARELAAILGAELKLNLSNYADHTDDGVRKLRDLGTRASRFRVCIDPASRCRRFMGIEIENVSVTTSPLWLRRRLFAVGAGTRNLLVDLSNYVMHEVGQPNHVYDMDRLVGTTINVRLARSGEEFVGLDAVKRQLSDEDVVIADESGPICLGAVIGGDGSAVSETTTRIFVESANFEPVLTRKSAKRHQLRTDASNRFEKNRSPYACPVALHRFAELIKKIDANSRIASKVAEDFVERPAAVRIPLEYNFVRRRLGADIDDGSIISILTSLGFVPDNPAAEDVCNVLVPYERAMKDVTVPEDLVEEVGRIYGYENIPEVAPHIESSAARRDTLKELEYRIRDLLSGCGFSEVYNYSFVNSELALSLGYSLERAVELINSVSVEEKFLRTSLVPGIVDNVEKNSRFFGDISIFELGRVYSDKNGCKCCEGDEKNYPTCEKRNLVVAYRAEQNEVSLGALSEPQIFEGAEFYSLLSLVKRLAAIVTRKQLMVEPISAHSLAAGTLAAGTLARNENSSDARSIYCKWMHPYRCAVLKIGDRPIGVIAEVSPGIVASRDGRAIVAELCLEDLILDADATHSFIPVAKYPDALFEISVVMPKKEPYAKLERAIYEGSLESGLLKKIDVLSVYIGEPLAEGEKSVSVKLSFGSSERTLLPDEFKTARDLVVKSVENHGYSLRQ